MDPDFSDEMNCDNGKCRQIHGRTNFVIYWIFCKNSESVENTNVPKESREDEKLGCTYCIFQSRNLVFVKHESFVVAKEENENGNVILPQG